MRFVVAVRAMSSVAVIGFESLANCSCLSSPSGKPGFVQLSVSELSVSPPPAAPQAPLMSCAPAAALAQHSAEKTVASQGSWNLCGIIPDESSMKESNPVEQGPRGQIEKRRRRIDRSMIGEPTNFVHTAHVGSGDLFSGMNSVSSIQNQMQSKGGYGGGMAANVQMQLVDTKAG
ncbi:hypothetical protein CB1_000719027 [Camelus ferus]|nr:hypothetical protein CB1_000719027 [Camelus ferus]